MFGQRENLRTNQHTEPKWRDPDLQVPLSFKNSRLGPFLRDLRTSIRYWRRWSSRPCPLPRPGSFARCPPGPQSSLRRIPAKGRLYLYKSTFVCLFFFWFVCAQFGSIESCTGFAGFYLSRAFAWSLLAIRDVRSWDMSLTLAQNLKLGSNDVQHSCLGRALGPFFVWFS